MKSFCLCSRWLWLGLALIQLAVAGCGSRSVQGGTKGTLVIDGEGLLDIRLAVHRLDGNSTEIVGFGVTKNDGSFDLLKNGARGSLWLAPGDYRFTLESVGPPIRIPQEYAQAETTPLKVSWTGSNRPLTFEVSLPPNRRQQRR